MTDVTEGRTACDHMLDRYIKALGQALMKAFHAGRHQDEIILFCLDRSDEPWQGLSIRISDLFDGKEPDVSVAPITFGCLDRDTALALFEPIVPDLVDHIREWPLHRGEVYVLVGRGEQAGLRTIVYEERPYDIN